MKAIFSILLMVLFLGGLKAQKYISIQLRHENDAAVKGEEVGEIKVFVLGDDGKVIHTETFLNPPLVNGLANLEIGSGSNHNAYIAAVNNYFKDLQPQSEMFMTVLIEASLKNGKLIKFEKEIKLNDPVPVIKVNNDQSVVVGPYGINMADANRNAHFNAREMFLGDTSDLENTLVDPTGMNIYSGQNRFAHFSSDGINMIKDEEYAKFLLGSGLDLQSTEYKSSYGLNGGRILNRLNGDHFNFSANEFSLGRESNSFWFFNQSGGGFNSGTSISHQFANNFFGIKDDVSKRESRLFYNGLSGYHNNLVRFNLGLSTSGAPLFQFLNSANKLYYNMSPNTDGVIDITSHNPDGAFTYRSTSLSGTSGKNPYVYITQDGGPPGAGMYYNSNNVPVIFALVKNFRMDHPELADQDIVYASLEGPEAAAYCRGKGQLTQGKQFIPFPDHFRFVCSPNDLTIQLTPRSAKSRGLAVTEITKEGFRIEELMEGAGNYEFFWEVKGTRKGFEDYQVIRPKSEVMPVPFKGQETKE